MADDPKKEDDLEAEIEKMKKDLQNLQKRPTGDDNTKKDDDTKKNNDDKKKDNVDDTDKKDDNKPADKPADKSKDKPKDDDKDDKKTDKDKKDKDIDPKRGASFMKPQDITPYNPKRRLSQQQTQEMKQNIEKMQQALIDDPVAASRKFSKNVDTIEEDDDKEDNPLITDKTQQNMENAIKSPKDSDVLPPLTFKSVMLGLCPIWFLVILGIFALIVYSVASYPADEETASYQPGPYGDWPNWGGNLKNQQRAPNGSLIDSSTVNGIEVSCYYDSNYPIYWEYWTGAEGQGMGGYIATDMGSINGFFVDYSGYVTSINLDDCSENWRVYISNATGRFSWIKEPYLGSANGLSLYMDSMGRKGVLIGGPNYGMKDVEDCYVLSLDQDTGDVLWSLSLNANGSPYSCKIDGFIVDGQYAYGGVYTSDTCSSQYGYNCAYRGEFIKIDLDNDGMIVDRWYSLPEIPDSNNMTEMVTKKDYYWGAAPYNYPSIIGDYIIVGTGSLWGNPDNISACLMSDIGTSGRASPNNTCDMDRSGYNHWRCLEDDVGADSINILQKSVNSSLEDFMYVTSIQLEGNDLYNGECNIWDGVWNSYICGGDEDVLGSGGDAIAQAAYTDDEMDYVAFITKSGMFWVVNVPDGDIIIAKKVSKSGMYGGGLYSLAIDETGMIAIVTITGTNTNNRNMMADGEYICRTGWVEAIDLTTGLTTWQLINPYGLMGDDCVTDSTYDTPDWSVVLNGPPCSRQVNGSDMISPSMTPDVNVVYPPQSVAIDDQYLRAQLLAPVTIANDLVFIPSMSGEVWIVDIEDGELVHTLYCRNFYDSSTGLYFRAGISAGVTVASDRVLVYCGAGITEPIVGSSGNRLYAYKLDEDSHDDTTMGPN